MTNKKSLNKLIEDIDKKLNEGYNFVDFFLTIGSNPSIFQNEWLYESDLPTLNTKYKDQLKPVIINKFPSNDKKLVGFDEAIIQHCFPNGFEVEEFNKQPEYKIFSILLDNNNYSINYPFKYVVCLRFYESIGNYKKLYDKYNENKKINIPKDSDINEIVGDDEDDMKPSKSLNISINGMKKKYLFNENIKICENGDIFYPEPLDGDISEINYNSSDTQLKYDLTKNMLRKTEFDKYCNKDKNIINEKHEYKKYYIPKCICLISLYPFINELSKIIKNIYQYSLVEKQIHPLEKIINNLLIEVPTPPKGIYSVEYSLINENILLQATQRNDFHLLNIEFAKLFMLFNTNKILEIFRYLMLNTKIIIFSKEITNLTPVILSLLSLLYPFHYPYTVVSILHKEAYKLIDNITPVLVGINEKYNKNFLAENDVDICDFTLIVNIDKQELIELEPEQNKSKKPLPDLPSKYKNNLENKMNNCIVEIKKNKKMVGKTNYLQQNIRKYFLEFQMDIMKDYSKYLNNDIYKHEDDGKKPIEKAFKLKEFLNKVPSEYYNFYEYFLNTQMFCDFIYKRMMPRDKIEQIDILFFEELLLKNKSDCILLNSKAYKFTQKYQVPKPTPLTLQQIYYFNHFDNRNKLLLNGIEITNQNYSYERGRRKSFNFGPRFLMDKNFNNNLNNQNNLKYDDTDASIKKLKNHKISAEESILLKNNKYNKSNPLFSYIIFPKLDNQYFYSSDIKNYHIDFSMFQEVKKIDNELLSRSHLRRVEVKTNETINYINLLWLKLWVSSLHYQDKQEHKYRFFQMLNVIERISQHEMGVINNLFEVLVKYKIDDDLILLLYQNILYYQFIPSNFIFRKIGTLINNKKNKSKTFNISKHLKSLKDKLKKDYEESIKSKKYFRKRTLRSIYDTGILEEKVTFLLEDNCDKCDKIINMNQFMVKINDTNNDLLWAKCPFCGSSYLPKLKIIFGSENNKNNRLLSNTSIVDNVMLYSPKTLIYDMFDNMQNNNMINIEELKIINNPFFWNVIWHFKMKKLPYDFILPYEQNILYRLVNNKPKEKEKEINNNKENNNDVKEKNISKNFKVTFCDYVQKAREEMDYRREFWNTDDELTIASNNIDLYIPSTSNYNKFNYLKSSINNYSKITDYE